MFMVALPPAEPPARVVAGVTITWPLAQPETQVAPGTRLTVRVRSERRRAKLSFVRVNAAGKGLATVAKRTLRRGSFTVTVPSRAGARYALRLDVAGRKRFSWVTTPVPVPVPVPEVAPPAPAASTPPPLCPEPRPPGSWLEPELLLGSTPVRPGDTLVYSVINRFDEPIRVMREALLARVGDPPGDAAGDWTTLEAGATDTRALVIPADLAFGTYVLRLAASAGQCDIAYTGQRSASPPFEVVPG